MHQALPALQDNRNTENTYEACFVWRWKCRAPTCYAIYTASCPLIDNEYLLIYHRLMLLNAIFSDSIFPSFYCKREGKKKRKGKKRTEGQKGQN